MRSSSASLAKKSEIRMAGSIDKSEKAMVLNRLIDFLKRNDFDISIIFGCVIDDKITALY